MRQSDLEKIEFLLNTYEIFDGTFMNSKPFYKSKTIWGALISLISFIVVFFVSHNVQDKYFAINGALSSIFTIYGRVKAEHKIHFKVKKAKS